MKFRPSEVVDFLIIGAGAAGGVMAKEISTAGFQVVVLEQGPYLRERDFKHDEIKYTMHHGLTNDPKVQPVAYRRNENEPTKLWKAIEYGSHRAFHCQLLAPAGKRFP
jgi:choline dehydrogenase-like flavoprotein